MNTALHIRRCSPGLSVQDAGRLGWRAFGVPVSGALDALYLAAANRLAGNPPHAAALELRPGTAEVSATDRPVRLALAGHMRAQRIEADGAMHRMPSWCAFDLIPGQALRMDLSFGVAYVGVGGGLLTETVLGSRSTYARAALGGLDGRLLHAGDRLPCLSTTAGQARLTGDPLRHEEGEIRAIAGPQAECFTEAALRDFQSRPYQVGSGLDRMGMRLSGTPLTWREPHAHMFSDGVVPGAVQVPADGQPIVLLADCQTVGGYPKIAVVIQADLPRLAQVQPGELLRFRLVDLDDAAAARAAQRTALEHWAQGLRYDPRPETDAMRLLGANLAGAAVRGDDPHLWS